MPFINVLRIDTLHLLVAYIWLADGKCRAGAFCMVLLHKFGACHVFDEIHCKVFIVCRRHQRQAVGCSECSIVHILKGSHIVPFQVRIRLGKHGFIRLG